MSGSYSSEATTTSFDSGVANEKKDIPESPLCPSVEPFKMPPNNTSGTAGMGTGLSAKATPFTFKPRVAAIVPVMESQQEYENHTIPFHPNTHHSHSYSQHQQLPQPVGFGSAYATSQSYNNSLETEDTHGQDHRNYPSRGGHHSRGGRYGGGRKHEPIQPIGMGRRPSHARSRSDIVHGNTAIGGGEGGYGHSSRGVQVEAKASAKSGGVEADVSSREGAIVISDSVQDIPPPRSMTPLPFKRPTYATQQQARPASLHGNEASLFHAGKRPGLPSLAEMGARMRAKGAVYVGERETSPVRETGAQSEQSSPVRQGPSAAGNKRYSMESDGSAGSLTSSSSDASVVERTMATPSAPSTPSKSRLPAFLQHRRTESGTSIISSEGQVSPTRSTHILRDAVAILKTPEHQIESGCPVLRVIPPSVETTDSFKAPNHKRMSSSAAMMQAMLLESANIDTPSRAQQSSTGLPIITCTPATALGAAEASPLAMLEAEVQKQRLQGGKNMMSTLGRRNRAAAT